MLNTVYICLIRPSKNPFKHHKLRKNQSGQQDGLRDNNGGIRFIGAADNISLNYFV